MGTASRSGLNSRIFTNSFAHRNNQAYAPYYLRNVGDSFYNLSKPQYSHQTYYQLAMNGAGAGGRAGRWERAHRMPPISFIPSTSYNQI